MSQCGTIEEIRIRFRKHVHSRCKNAHLRLNDTHSFALPDLPEPFDDDDTLREDCVSIIHRQIIEQIEVHAQEDGSETEDMQERFKDSPSSWNDGDDSTAIRNQRDVMCVMDTAIQNDRT